MGREAIEAILFHFRDRLAGGPAVVGHSINRRHYAGSVAAPLTVHKHGLICRITHQTEEETDRRLRGPGRRSERDSIKFHAALFDHRLLVTVAFAGQVNYGSDSERGEFGKASCTGLRTTVIGVANLAEVIYMDTGK